MRALAAIVPVLGIACASATAPSPLASNGASATASSSASAKPSASAAPLPTTLLPGVGMSSKKPSAKDDEDDDALSGPPIACAKDEDCWSKTCCPAKTPEQCVHASRARKCAIVDIKCEATPIHYTCVCDSGACRGRLAPP
jgi:hypothetical protein